MQYVLVHRNRHSLRFDGKLATAAGGGARFARVNTWHRHLPHRRPAYFRFNRYIRVSFFTGDFVQWPSMITMSFHVPLSEVFEVLWSKKCYFQDKETSARPKPRRSSPLYARFWCRCRLPVPYDTFPSKLRILAKDFYRR